MVVATKKTFVIFCIFFVYFGSSENVLDTLPRFLDNFLESSEVSQCTPILIYDPDRFSQIFETFMKSEKLLDRPMLIFQDNEVIHWINPRFHRKKCHFYIHLTQICSPEFYKRVDRLIENKMMNSFESFYHMFWMSGPTSQKCVKNKLRFLPSSLYLQVNANDSKISLHEVTTESEWKTVGYVFPGRGFVQLYDKLFEVNDCERNLVAAFLTMDQALVNPDDYMGNYANAQIWPTIQYLEKRGKLKFTFVERTDNVYGLPGPNGSFTGMVGMLERGEIDFVFGPMGYNRYRDAVADYTGYHFTTSSVFYRIKSGFLPKWQALIWPFDNLSWVIIVSLIFLVGFTYILILHMSNKNRDISGCLLNTISIFLGEGYHVKVGWVSEYMLLLFWIMYSMIILLGYGGLLKSCLVSLERQKSVVDVDGIYKSEKHDRIGMWIGGFMHGFYKNSASDSLRKIMFEKELIHIETAAEGFQALHDGQIDILLQNDKETMLIIDRYKSLFQSQPFDSLYRRFIVRNNSRFMGVINEGLGYYMASGLNHHEREIVRNNLQKIQEERNPDLFLDSTETKADQLKALTINDLQGGFWLLLFGFLLSSLSVVLEIAFPKLQRQEKIR